MFLVGYLLQRLVISPIIEAERHAQLLMTFGLMLVIKNLALYFWKGTYRVIMTPYTNLTWWFGGIMFEASKILSFFIAIGLSILLHFFLSKTSLGMAIRAVSQDGEAASAMGIDTAQIFRITCGLGIAFAGVAGALTTTFYPIFPDLGVNFMFMAFIVMVLGSMGNYMGALFAGLIIGVTETTSAYFLISSLRQAIAFLIFVLILLLKPEGLFGRALRR
jgi:branched-chain amino acid transport system permease protein